MTKQEFLAFSLPYKLRVNIHRLTNMIFGSVWYTREFEDREIISKPILHPLTDLTKEIEHNGEVFVPTTRLKLLYEFESDNVCEIRMYINSGWTSSISELPLDIVLQLISWHFDLFNGIEKGEAIDVNTLDENPYKHHG